MQDSKFLHFLKEFPAWIVLFVLVLLLIWLWLTSQQPFLEHIIDTSVGGLLTILIGRKVSNTQSGQTGSGDIYNVSPDLQSVKKDSETAPAETAPAESIPLEDIQPEEINFNDKNFNLGNNATEK